MPVEEEKSLGVAFIKVDNAIKACEAVSAIHGFAIDKKHTIAASTFDEFNTYLEVKDTLEIPKCADLLDLNSYQFDAYND